MDKMIIVKPDETVVSVDYEGYDSIHDAVDGLYEIFHRTDLPVGFLGKVKTSFYCNEEFLCRNDEKFDKLNAFATLVSGLEIRGDIVILPQKETPDGIDCRGFEYLEEENCGEIEEAFCEHWFAEDTVMRYISKYKDKLNELHERYDNNKSKPMITFLRD